MQRAEKRRVKKVIACGVFPKAKGSKKNTHEAFMQHHSQVLRTVYIANLHSHLKISVTSHKRVKPSGHLRWAQGYKHIKSWLRKIKISNVKMITFFCQCVSH